MATVWGDGTRLIYQVTSPGPDWSIVTEESPQVFFVSPAIGLTGGGDPDDPNDVSPSPLHVTVCGYFFADLATVTFGGTSATDVEVIDKRNISCYIPAHTAGAVNVIVSNPAAALSGTLTSGFTYVVQAPVILQVTPATGTSVGGTAVILAGRHFISGAVVSFGELFATSVVVVNSQEITCVTPDGVDGLVDVRVDV